MFSKILIANRGEIAVRVAKTARRMGIATVAVYSDADRDAPHVRLADEAINIGPAPATESYLRIDHIIAAAKATGAEAIHPGYGFLSENAEFADALDAAGIVFIGPRADTIRAMGSKAAAKDLMEAAGVPTLPGYQGEAQSLDVFLAEAERIGYPVLLKATAGGGGKGMRQVDRAADLESALESARREALSSFGDDRFLVEKFLEEPRHIEVQIFGDGEGEVVHVFERDCSVQRRHQKVIEEAPAPNLPAGIRKTLLEAGVRAGEAINYRGAGTVEFLYDGRDGIYFMEMNTRLQVEHPVSEAISGLDFVEWQLRIAAGEGLPGAQDDILEQGHAFESRLYAEDPPRGFAPSIGTLSYLDFPGSARIDSGVEQGQEISPHYDPMIAKIITYGPDRESALERMASALAATRIAGLETNASFLHAICTEADFIAGKVSTAFIDEHRESLFEAVDAGAIPEVVAALWATRVMAPCDDPWNSLPNWRLNQPAIATLGIATGDGVDVAEVSRAEREFTVAIERQASAAERRGNSAAGEELAITGSELRISGNDVCFDTDSTAIEAVVAEHRSGLRVWLGARHYDMELVDLVSTSGQHKSAEGSLEAPMPGVIVSVKVAEGDAVEAGDTLLILEAMKMEHQVHAPGDGVVRRVLFKAGDQVREGDLLMEVEESLE